MDISVDELSEMRSKLDELITARDKNAWLLQERMTQLKEMGFDSLEEVRKSVDEKEQRKLILIEQIQNGIKELREKWNL